MALYYAKGFISHMSEIKSGTGNSGKEWARMTIMLDVPGYQGSIYKIQFQVETAHIDDVLKFKNGDKVEIGFSLYAREWNGKWYNNVDLVNIKSADTEGTQVAESAPVAVPSPAPRQAAAPVVNDISNMPQEEREPQGDDLPF